MPLRSNWGTSALLSFLCSQPYHKWSDHAKISSPVPIPSRAWPGNCPGISHSSENTSYFPGCTVVPQTPSVQPRVIWRKIRWLCLEIVRRNWSLTFESHVWLGGGSQYLALPNVLKVIGSFPSTRRKMNEQWWISSMILLFSDKSAGSMAPGSILCQTLGYITT